MRETEPIKKKKLGQAVWYYVNQHFPCCKGKNCVFKQNYGGLAKSVLCKLPCNFSKYRNNRNKFKSYYITKNNVKYDTVTPYNLDGRSRLDYDISMVITVYMEETLTFLFAFFILFDNIFVLGYFLSNSFEDFGKYLCLCSLQLPIWVTVCCKCTFYK